MAKKIAIILAFFLAFLAAEPALAGFGISPPYVKSDRLIPGGRYEQEITLLRSDANEDLEAEIVINAPEIDSWITVTPGMKFDLPKDRLQVQMMVVVEPPKEAPLGPYQGHINVRISPKQSGGSGVAIALGARIDIDLNLTDETYPDFNVRTIAVPDIEELSFPWNLRIFSYFFYRIRAVMKIENTGNVDTAPTRVTIEVWDITKKKQLETATDRRYDKVRPNETRDIIADFPTRLPVGQYWAKTKVFRQNDIVKNDEIAFTVAPPGGLGDLAPKLGPWPYVALALTILAGLAVLLLMVRFRAWRIFIKASLLIIWPVWTILRLFGRKLGGAISRQFRRWVRAKAREYQDDSQPDQDRRPPKRRV